MIQNTDAAVKAKSAPFIGLLGQPNTGKSTVFNALTGAHQHVGNWPGKTVERKEGYFRYKGKSYTLLDLPGTYSLSANSEEEVITRHNIIGKDIDIVLALVDASQLERSMFLISEIVGIRQPTAVLLNMMDIAKAQGSEIDVKQLSELLGVPVLPIVASRNEGIDALYTLLDEGHFEQAILKEDALQQQYETKFGHSFLELETLLAPFQTGTYNSLWLAAKLLEGDKEITADIQSKADNNTWNNIQSIVQEQHNGLLSSADCKFNWLHAITEKVLIKRTEKASQLNTFDKLATSPYVGKILALGILGLAIFASFKIGYALMGAMGNVWGIVMGWAYTAMAAIYAPAFLTSFICDALITSFFYSLMMASFVLGMIIVMGLIEEIGYMARVSYVFDHAMQRLGLHGKAIMSFLLCFGCTIAGVTGTRVLDSGKQRLLAIATCWVLPCSAMWGVISLLGSTFFGSNAVWVILLLCATAFLFLIGTSVLFSHSLNTPEDRTGLIMELPPYHAPNFKTFLRQSWTRLFGIFKKAVVVIMGVTVVFWLLSYTPDGNITGSIIYKVGKMIEPFTMLFGLSWELFIAFLISAIGKESSLGVITTLFAQHTAMGNVYNAAFLGAGLATGDVAASMLASISAPQALAFMFAFFFNVPCFMTVAATVGEVHSTKWTLRIVLYYMISALLLAGIVYRIALLFYSCGGFNTPTLAS